MYDLSAALNSLTSHIYLADSASDSTVKAAIVAGLALVCATGITAFASTLQRTRQPVPADPAPSADPAIEAALVTELRRRAEKAERELGIANRRIDVLETLCWDSHVNPHTGRAT